MLKKLTPLQSFTIIKDVQRNLFDSFKYETDLKQYGEVERWTLPWLEFAGDKPKAKRSKDGKLIGDCEDYALVAKQKLSDAGISSNLAICLTEMGEGHCVLVIGKLVIDNRYKEVMTVQKLISAGYQFLCINIPTASGTLVWERCEPREV